MNIDTAQISRPIYLFLKKFTHLKSINLRGVKIGPAKIMPFLGQSNKAFTSKQMVLKICSAHRSVFKKAIVDLDSRFILEDTRDVVIQQIERGSRESTPEDFEGEDAEFALYKRRVKEGVKQDDCQGKLKDVLVKFGLTEKYVQGNNKLRLP